MSLIRSGSRTPTPPPAPEKSAAAPSPSARASTPTGERVDARRQGAADASDGDHRTESDKPRARPTLSQPVPQTPAHISVAGRRSAAEPAARRASTSQSDRVAMSPSTDVRAIHSEPALSELRPAPRPTDYQEHFYQLGSVIVNPAHGQDARALLSVTERKEGLKMYFYEPSPGALYAISHAPSELHLPDGKSTQHQELQKALLFTGVAKCTGRFATEDKAQRAANKMVARAFTDKKPHPAHGGLRLQKHEGRYVLDVSSAFSFHGASEASLEHIARFYANVLKQAEHPVTSVGVIPAEAAGSPALCIAAAPHLQDLARRIENYLDA